jgi:hypothetical protein
LSNNPTEAQAEEFLASYCFALIDDIAKSVARQEKPVEKAEWDKFQEHASGCRTQASAARCQAALTARWS